jgi:hypothetical protein
MYRAFGIAPGEATAEAKQLNATASATQAIYEKMDPNDPNRAAVKDDMCKQYRLFLGLQTGYGPESYASVQQDARKAGCI